MAVFLWFIWYILQPFHIFYGNLVHFFGNLVYFSLCWYIGPRKIWQPWSERWHSACWGSSTNCWPITGGKSKALFTILTTWFIAAWKDSKLQFGNSQLKPATAGWPDEFALKSPNVQPKPFLVKINTKLFREKNCAASLIFEKWPQLNNYPILEQIRPTWDRCYDF
jgi:hypothetical protein